jgi:hypothetical protein
MMGQDLSQVCKITHFRIPNDSYICMLCEKVCNRYCIMICKKESKSLIDYSKDCYFMHICAHSLFIIIIIGVVIHQILLGLSNQVGWDV